MNNLVGTSETGSCCHRRRSQHTRPRGVARSDAAPQRIVSIGSTVEKPLLGQTTLLVPRLAFPVQGDGVYGTGRTARVPPALLLFTTSSGLRCWCRRHPKHGTRTNNISPCTQYLRVYDNGDDGTRKTAREPPTGSLIISAP